MPDPYVPEAVPVADDDEMIDGGRDRYLTVGRQAADLVGAFVGDATVRSVLDYPCGHGRVGRFLKARWPDAVLSVSDLNESGVRFCEDALGATALRASEDFDALDYGTTFDVMWVGSLATHLPPAATRAFLRFVARHLSRDGTAVVTSHGDLAAGRMKFAASRNMRAYGNPPERNRACLRDYFAKGYGFIAYEADPNYGTSLIDRRCWQRLAAEAGLTVSRWEPRAWDEHQDVLGLRHVG